MRQGLAVLCVVVAACAGLVGCTDSPTGPTAATISLSAAPNPVVPGPSTDAAYAWHASFSVTITDTAAVSATIGTITASLKQSSGGIVIVSGTTESVRLVVHSDTNRVTANGQTTIGFDVDYTLPSGGHEAVVDVAVALTDDNSVSQTLTVRVNVQ